MGSNEKSGYASQASQPFIQNGDQPVTSAPIGYAGAQAGYAPQGYAQGYPAPQGVAYAPGAPITTQPFGQPNAPQIQWMTKPENVLNCPPGLEYLSTIDQLLVQQQVDFLELMSNYEMENRYIILNTLGQHIYFAQEVSGECGRNCCGGSRQFEMKVTDNFGNLVINLRRPFACATCCFPCCLDSMEVFAPAGTLVGRIEQQWSCFSKKFTIKDASEKIVLRILGPCCTSACCSDVEFKIMSADGDTEVGKICKQWGGYAKESYTNADNFGIQFPMDLDVGMKAVMLGACFLIDFLYYETRPNQNKNRNQRGGVHGRRL